MKKIRKAGIFGALGFLFGTLVQIAIWKTDEGTQWIYNNGGLLPFALTPIYAVLSAALMTGYFGFKDKFIGKDDKGNRVFSAFWSVALLMEVMGILVAIEAVLEA
jgi:cytochrome b